MKLTIPFSDPCCTLRPVKALSAGRARKKIRIALAGNANVGKSALFNYLTGLSQHVANWPGKTVQMAEGAFLYGIYEISVIDLPGIYSLSTFSKEEEVTREYILKAKPDIVINVIDSCSLERNLFFTLQLLELGVPVVLALNQTDVAKRKGIEIDAGSLGTALGVPAIKTIATTGRGVWELIGRSCDVAVKPRKQAIKIKYGAGTEAAVGRLEKKLVDFNLPYPPRYAAMKLLENDAIVRKDVESRDGRTLKDAERCASEIRRQGGVAPAAMISRERYNAANRIASKAQTILEPKEGLVDRIDALTMNRFFGYPIMFLVLGVIFYSIFAFGNIVSTWMGDAFNSFRPPAEEIVQNLLWEGLIGGFVAGVTLVMPYVLPFYFLVTLLEDTGYITRIAYLLDGFAHRIGFHGKAIIPLILGYGCNVPACFTCRIMEYDRDRLIAAFAITLVPCTARTVVVLALVGTYLGPLWAIGLYLSNIIIIALLSKLAFSTLPGEPMGLIMEMPAYKIPSLTVILKHTWWKIRSILSVVFPYYIVGGLLFAIAYVAGVFGPVNNLFAPITMGWLGLPALATTLLIFGVVRKEFIVVLPVVVYGTTELSLLFTPLQMVVLTVVAMLYMPCLATMEALRREFGWKKAVAIGLFDTSFAILAGGLVLRALPALGLLG